MIRMNIQQSENGIGIRLNGITKELNKLPAESVVEMKRLTPIDTGNARSKTKLKNKTTIEAGYNYATSLDHGHSKQAPNGMTKPLYTWIKKRADYIILRKG